MSKGKKRTPNPIFNIPAGTVLTLDVNPDPNIEGIQSLAADILIRQSLEKCSATEKMLIAGLIPQFVKMIRAMEREPDKATPGRASSSPTKPTDSTEAKP